MVSFSKLNSIPILHLNLRRTIYRYMTFIKRKALQCCQHCRALLVNAEIIRQKAPIGTPIATLNEFVSLKLRRINV